MNIFRQGYTLLIVGLLAVGCGSGVDPTLENSDAVNSGIEGRDTERLRRQVTTLSQEKEHYATSLEATLEQFGGLQEALAKSLSDAEAVAVAAEEREAALETAVREREAVLTETLEAANARAEALPEQFGALEEMLQERVAAFGSLEERLQTLEEEVSVAKGKNVELERVNVRLEGQVEDTDAEIEYILNERDTFKAKVKEVSDEKIQQQGDAWRLEMEVNTEKRKVAELTEENARLQEALVSAQTQPAPVEKVEEIAEEEAPVPTPKELESRPLPTIPETDAAGEASPPSPVEDDAPTAKAEPDTSETDGRGRHAVRMRVRVREEHAALMERVGAGDLDVLEAFAQLSRGVNSRDPFGVPPLLEAARSGQTEMIAALLAAGAKVYARDRNGNTALHLAAAANQLYQIEMLHARGLDVELKNRDHFTALHVATEAGHLDAVRTLADLGANGDYSYFSGGAIDPLVVAYKGKHVQVAKYLRELGAERDVHFYARHGDVDALRSIIKVEPLAVKLTDAVNAATPLLVAMKFRQYHAANYLLRFGGANVFDRDISLNSPLSVAAHQDWKEGVDLILDNGFQLGQLTGSYESGFAQIHVSAELDSVEMMEHLLKRGATVNQQDGHGNTPLQRAVGKNRLAMATFLLDRGARANSLNKVGETALHTAARNGRADMVALLLDRGAQMTIQNGEGDHPFHLAVIDGNSKIVKSMHALGYDVSTRGAGANTPLYLAARWGWFDLVKYLVGAGANVDVQNASGATPLHGSLGQRRTEVAKYLMEQGASIAIRDKTGKTPLFTALLGNRLDIVKALLARGESLEDSDIEGLTPLFYTVEDKKGELVRFALEHGANVNHQAHDGRTPLHAAAEMGSLPALVRLVDGGADVDAVDGEGRTPLHLAAIRGTRNHAEVLLEHGANVNATDGHGQNVLHLIDGKALKHDMRFYLRHGADLHLADGAGNTPYLAMARRANLTLLYRYFVQGADIAVKNEAGESAIELVQAQIQIPKPNRTWPPKVAERQELLREAKKIISDQIGKVLGLAAASGDLKMLAYVLETYPDHLQKVTKDRPTPLWAASKNGQLEAVKFLVGLGAHKPYRVKFGLMMNDVDRFHILHEAARHGHLEVLQYYIDALGIAWKKKDADGKTLREVSKDRAVLAYLETISGGEAGDRLVAAEALVATEAL